ncbi:MAG: transcriptional repressor [Eubacteriales bacterium]|nr:transcriptional repressor [Eubacteriales bacterium]
MILKYSRQREAIYQYLQSRHDHPTADAVYDGVRQTFPNISLGTVYRNLILLRDIGKIRSVDVGDGVIHFDPDLSEHNHFVCRECGCVQDIKMKSIDRIKEIAGEHFDGRITGYTTYFYGICSDCLQKQNEALGKAVSAKSN